MDEELHCVPEPLPESQGMFRKAQDPDTAVELTATLVQQEEESEDK